MRLTLRTLLAYLDDTLEPQDAETLREKLQQSSYATQLVQRIRASLSDPTLSAPNPESVHPIEEPNMMSDYLDSTLSPEQITEIEKACLESPAHLAEAAACHQILTMVIGQPANVSQPLRDRVLAMVDADGNVVQKEQIAIAGEIGPRHSGIEIPVEDQDAFTQPESVGVDVVAPTQVRSDVKPVGAGDSGVFQAASRLREQSNQFANTATAFDDNGALAGARPLRALEKSDYYDGEVRPSRITPWLVSLALVFALLFAISKVAAPLFRSQIAQTEPSSDAEGLPELPPDDVVGEIDPSEDLIKSADEILNPREPASDIQSDKPDQQSASTPADESLEPLNQVSGDSETFDAPPIPPGMENLKSESEMVSSVAPIGEMAEELMESTKSDAGVPAPDSVVASEMAEPIEVDDVPDAAASDQVVGKLVSEKALVARLAGEGIWKLLSTGDEVTAKTLVACGPEYRPQFSLGDESGMVLSIVGPSKVAWMGDPQSIDLDVRFGRGILSGISEGVSALIRIDDGLWSVASQADGGTIAYRVVRKRKIGDDPLLPENHSTEVLMTAVEGDFQIGTDQGNFDLTSGSTLRFSAAGDTMQPAATKVQENVTEGNESLVQLPEWIDPEVDMGTLESEAASALLGLVQQDGTESLLLSLRSALNFRRSEVAALAGKTMLALGDASAYFGVDGLFSKEKQRLYWPSHLDSIRSLVDRSVADAAEVRKAIAGQNEAMDNSDGDTLFRLLIGYSQEQLEAGGDAELVSGLESASVAVRVLASENLRDISGTTLFFQPEEEIANRRDEVVKKWKVRLRKGTIRYPDTE